MARIDRRVSPNQTALWTVYELVAIQAARVTRRARHMVKPLSRDGRHRWSVARIARAALRRLRMVFTRRRGWSGQQRECLDVARSDDGEVAVVEGGDLVDVQAFGQGDHGCVAGAQG